MCLDLSDPADAKNDTSSKIFLAVKKGRINFMLVQRFSSYLSFCYAAEPLI